MDKNIAENSITEGVPARWKPTLQQKEILESVYRNKTRTPTVEEIESITLDLKKYGRIEGKNVFYWFQNFNARERENRKRTLELSHSMRREEASRDTAVSIQKLESGSKSHSGGSKFQESGSNSHWGGSKFQESGSNSHSGGSEFQESGSNSHWGGSKFQESGSNSQTSKPLELFPLKPDGGGLGLSRNTRSVETRRRWTWTVSKP